MIKELQTFLQIIQSGTFSAAAKKIGLTQAAVSVQVQRLEAELNIIIFERSGRTMKLTARGQQLLMQAQELMLLYENLGLRNNTSTVAKTISIAAIASLQKILLPDGITAFHLKHPAIRTKIMLGNSVELLNLIDSKQIDIAAMVRPPFPIQNELQWSSLFLEPYRLIVPADMLSNDIEDILIKERFIRYDRSTFGGRQVDRFLTQHKLHINEISEVGELSAIIKLVGNATGVAIVPERLGTEGWPESVRAISLDDRTFYRELGLVHRHSYELNDPINSMVSFINEGAKMIKRESFHLKQ